MPIIETDSLSYIYDKGSPNERQALREVDIMIGQGEFYCIMGANGSGKTTLIQHFNGLLKPCSGTVRVRGRDVSDLEYARVLWKDVGLVFQSPERQLFESDVFSDIAYGPINLGLGRQQIESRVKWAIEILDLDYEEISKRPIYSLSSGIRRLIAIAGVAAIQPQVLVLDEPTAGLDLRMREAVLRLLKSLQNEQGITIVMVSHSLNELLEVADRIAVLEEGYVKIVGSTKEIVAYVFERGYIEALPDHLKVIHGLFGSGIEIDSDIVNRNEAVRHIDILIRRCNS